MYTLSKSMQVTPPNELDRFDNATHLFRRAPNHFRVAHKKMSCACISFLTLSSTKPCQGVAIYADFGCCSTSHSMTLS
jgi:hypothetical protein